MPRVVTPLTVADFRKRLCDAAAELLAQHGIDGFNMRELAKRLQVSPMTAYRYFKDKDEILAQLRIRGFTRLADLLGDTQRTSGCLAAVQAYVRFALDEPVTYRLMFDLFQPGEQEQPEMARQRRRVSETMTELALGLLHDHAACSDAEAAGSALWSMVHGTISLNLAAKLDRSAAEKALAADLSLFSAAAVDAGDAWPPGQRSRPSEIATLSAAE